jgi:hypothetical protein
VLAQHLRKTQPLAKIYSPTKPEAETVIMNFQAKLTVAKLRKLFLVTALVICPFFALQSGHAQNTATATLTSGGVNFINILAGGSFTLTLGVTTNFTSLGYTVFLQSNDGSGFFTLSNRINLNPVFVDATDSDPFGLPGSAILNPSNDADLGFTRNGANTQAAGTFQLASYTVTVGALSPGVYHIFLDNRSIMTNTAFGDVPMTGLNGTAPQFFTVTVIPEPTTIGLAIVGGALLLVAVRRKQRARA